MNDLNNDLASRLNHLRKIKGLSIKELSNIAEVSTTSVSNWFNRGAISHNDTLQKLAKGLDTSIEYLLTGGKPKETISLILNKAAEEIAFFEGISKDKIILKLEIIHHS